ncbi:MAG: fructose-bisphosphatase class III [Candidatus Margulisbacteria bacterium]|nr:fructose-bisphosphatase class III [Candidatus Margulisiibacteriota bacterium]
MMKNKIISTFIHTDKPVLFYREDRQQSLIPYKFNSGSHIVIELAETKNEQDFSNATANIYGNSFSKLNYSSVLQLDSMVVVLKKEGVLSPATLKDLLKAVKDGRKTISLDLVSPEYIQFLHKFDSSISIVCISDPHGTPDKMMEGMRLFPAARFLLNGDFVDRGEPGGQFTTNMLLTSIFLDKTGKATNTQDALAVMGNHDAMLFGAAIGEKAAICDLLRLAFRFNEHEYLADKMGLNFSSLIALAKKQYHEQGFQGIYTSRGNNIKIKGEFVSQNRLLEVLTTEMLLKLVFSDIDIKLTEDEMNFLHNIKYSRKHKPLIDKNLRLLEKKLTILNRLEKLERAIVAAITVTDTRTQTYIAGVELYKEEITFLNDFLHLDQTQYIVNTLLKIPTNKSQREKEKKERVKIFTRIITDSERTKLARIIRGDHNSGQLLSLEEEQVILDLQLQIISNKRFQELAEMGFSSFKLYQKQKIGEKTFLFMHSNIPVDDHGNLRPVEIDGVQYSGINYLTKCQEKVDEIGKRYRDFIQNSRNAKPVEKRRLIKAFLNEINETRGFLYKLAWDYESPLFGRNITTLEQTRTSKYTGLWAEPEDPWFSVIQSEKGTREAADRFFEQIALQLEVEKDNIQIITGHKPSKDGLPKVYADGRIVCIDAGASGVYGNMGAYLLLSGKGTIYAMSLANENSNSPVLKKYDIFQLNTQTKKFEIIK